jgi:hypothetical protein
MAQVSAQLAPRIVIVVSSDDENNDEPQEDTCCEDVSISCITCGLHGVSRCGQCGSVYYCSEACQTAHWSHHHPFCADWKAIVEEPFSTSPLPTTSTTTTSSITTSSTTTSSITTSSTTTSSIGSVAGSTDNSADNSGRPSPSQIKYYIYAYFRSSSFVDPDGSSSEHIVQQFLSNYRSRFPTAVSDLNWSKWHEAAKKACGVYARVYYDRRKHSL